MKSSSITSRSALAIALALAVGGGYAAAQGKTAPTRSGQPAPATQSATKADMSCPMHEAAPVANVTVENGTEGAVIRLKAKKPSDVQRVQELAAAMVERMTRGGMEHGGMMHEAGMMHRGAHGKGSMGAGHGMKNGRPGATPYPSEPGHPHKH